MPLPEGPLHVHLDVAGGIAGDMFVAAMLDALPDLRERVLADVVAVLPEGAGEPVLTEGQSEGISCLRFGLQAPAVAPPDSASFADMVRRIDRADLSDGTARHAEAILTILANAEAAIHGVLVADVHFHEIGDWDSLADVVAAGSIVAALDWAIWTASPLPRGGGTVRTRHGLLPVPAPATAAILTGFTWRDDGVEGERVTPTGAAILRHLIPDPLARWRGGRLFRGGTGAGTRRLPDMPNVLRAMLFEPAGTERVTEEVVVLSFDVDDMTGEEIAVACDRLRERAGVLDLTTATRRGKKGRPIENFRLLVAPDSLEFIQNACFAETSTIGLRWHVEQRICLPRSIEQAGRIRVKRVRRPDRTQTVKAESDDVTGNTLAERRHFARRAEGEA
ncbi:MAG TPA: LarC family nickel insertion protein [Geminicoccus sp.]|jgi:hypothetical protein|uniref:LarC family nickel insertion protein n=1 Tax=Geminicoccus sp. TaxID=2024832 RepID=UPI002E330EC0|nr:LarC family nickel insertion protein [Geminicoccus sp.]HEX2527508.1 LarC family nickel insertion protein [Geminicoccus sp.]